MIKELGQQELNTLKQSSPYSLPDNPSDKGLNARQIKAKFYEGLIYLFNLMRESGIESNSMYKVLESEITKIINGTTKVAESIKATNDKNGNDIALTYAEKTKVDKIQNDVNTYKVNSFFNDTLTEIKTKFETNTEKSFGASNIKSIEVEIPSNVDHSFISSISFLNGKTKAVLSINNLSKYPLKTIKAGVAQTSINYNSHSSVQLYCYCDGIYVYIYVMEVLLQ